MRYVRTYRMYREIVPPNMLAWGSFRLAPINELELNDASYMVIPGCCKDLSFNDKHTYLTITYIRFRRMQEITSTATPVMSPIAAEIITTTSIATVVKCGYCSHVSHRGRQEHAFSLM